MSVTLWVYVMDCGDGTSVALFFRTKEDAEDYADQNEADRHEDDISETDLRFDTEGILLNPSGRSRSLN